MDGAIGMHKASDQMQGPVGKAVSAWMAMIGVCREGRRGRSLRASGPDTELGHRDELTKSVMRSAEGRDMAVAGGAARGYTRRCGRLRSELV